MLRDLYPGARVIDRRTKPQHGYRAVHVVVVEAKHYVEVQVRTRMQNEWAQLSEKLADVHDQAIKYGGGPQNVLDELTYLTEYCATVERREVALDEYKRAEVNALNRAKRAGKMTVTDRARLSSYQHLLAEKRNAKAAMLRYLRQEIES